MTCVNIHIGLQFDSCLDCLKFQTKLKITRIGGNKQISKEMRIKSERNINRFGTHSNTSIPSTTTTVTGTRDNRLYVLLQFSSLII